MSSRLVRVVGTTLTDLRREPTFHSELLTQVTNGVELEILKGEGEWRYVCQRDGYRGWAYAAYLVEPAGWFEPSHVVAASNLTPSGPLTREDSPFTRVPIGTAVMIGERRGEWARIDLVGDSLQGGWAQADGLRPLDSLPLPPDQAREQIVADARRLTGVYYLWGGTTAWGIDCSGLSQLCHRLAGYTLPRDSGMQFAAGRPVAAPFRAGELVFFHGESNRDRITHVGISTGGWRIIHSSRRRNGVYEEDLDSGASRDLRDRFAGARSFLE